jgi:hypothetical protein
MPMQAISSTECALSLGTDSDSDDPAHHAARISSPTRTKLSDR